DHPHRAGVEPGEARRHVDDRLLAERLPDGAAPAGGERALHLVARVRRRRRREPERIRTADPGEIDREIGHQRTSLRKSSFTVAAAVLPRCAASTTIASPAPARNMQSPAATIR